MDDNMHESQPAAEPSISEGAASGAVGSRRSTAVRAAGFIAVVALAILLFSAFGTGGKQAPERSDGTRVAGALVALSSEALESGDASRAAELAARALALDPGNTRATAVAAEAAKEVRRQAEDASSETSQGTVVETGKKVQFAEGKWDEGFSGTLSSPQVLVPVTFKGFTLDSKPEARANEVVASASAKSETAPVTQVIWTIRTMKDRKSALRFIVKTSEELYRDCAGMVLVDGVPTYYGADGTRFASAAYVRGRYVFEVVASGNGASGKTLRSTTLAAAAAFGDTAP